METIKKLLKVSLVLCICINSIKTFAQSKVLASSSFEKYRASSYKKNIITKTRLDISFSFEKQILYGKEWLSAQAFSKPVSSIELDAKGLNIKKVQILKGRNSKSLHYALTDQQLTISLDSVYNPGDTYSLYIEYETKPIPLSGGNKSALHFINPHEKQNGTPTQIWTSGQPENNSSWFPTIDKPNQKMKQEISLTIPAKFSTLSNGKLIKKQKLPKGLRKDTWKMDLPHSPYLFMLAIGEFDIITDYWKGKEVNYYVEHQFAGDQSAVRKAFPNTVEAMDYFSGLLGVDYPWNKYSQIKLHGFSGAMEHTTATCFNEDKQSSTKELPDKNYEPGNIHELFHQWFGNYVTAESWANICLNESFADLSEIIWAEHKFGSDVAGAHLLKGMEGYLSNEDGWKKDLVRFDYEKPEDVFDGIRYQKGGRNLNMLRVYLGNEVFYKGLHIYLTKNAYKNAEVHDLRLAMEDASGKDLNWFFNQWFFRSGHPELDIDYKFDETSNQNYVIIQQKQNGSLFKIPIKIDVYLNSGKTSRQVWLTKPIDTIQFESIEKPLLINVDADKILVAKKTDHKTLTQFAFQYAHSPLFQDRYEAVETAKKMQNELTAKEILITALNDQFYSIRTQAIVSVDFTDTAYRDSVLNKIIDIAESDLNNSTRAAAINKIGSLKSRKYLALFKRLLSAESYLVKGEALEAIGLIDMREQFELAKTIQMESKGKLKQVILQSYMNSGGDLEWKYVYDAYTNGNSPFQYTFTRQFADFIKKVENPAHAKQGILALKEIVTIERNLSIAPRVILFLNEIKPYKQNSKDTAAIKAIDDSIAEIYQIIK